MRLRAPRRWLLRLLIAVTAAPLVVIAATQAALSTPLLLAGMNAAFAGEVQFGYRSAWSPWPGRIHVRGLQIRGEDSNVQWLLRIEETDASVSLRELLHRTFHATWSRSRGVSFVARMKLARGDATPERLFGLVQIDGFAPLPLKREGPDELDTEARYRLWTVHLDDTEAEATEIWVQRFRLTGDALVTGGFFLKPVRRAQVEAQVHARGLGLSIGGDAVARDLRGHLAVTLHPFDPRLVHGIDVLGQVSLRAELEGGLAGLAFLQRTAPPGVRADAAPGPLWARLQVARGTLSAGSALGIRSPRATLALAGLRAEAEAALSVWVGDGLGTAALELTGVSLAPAGGFPRPMRAQGARLEVEGGVDLTRPPGWSHLAADLEGGEIPDLLILEAFLPPAARALIEGGRASIDGHLQATPAAASARLSVAAERLTVRAAGARLRGSVRVQALVRAGSTHRLTLSGSTLSIDRLAVLGGSGAPAWWGRFRASEAVLDPQGRALALQVTGRCRDARPMTAVLAGRGLPGFVADVFSMEGLRLRGGVRLAPGETGLLDLRAEGNGTGLRLDWRTAGPRTRGAALLSAWGLTAGVDLDDGNASLVLLEPTAWYLRRLEGTPLLRPGGTLRTQALAARGRSGPALARAEPAP